MAISAEQVRHVAKLARLQLSEQEIEPLARQIGSILDYIAALEHVDTAGVEPTFHAIALTNAFREDAPHEHLERAAALANAPAAEEGLFVVPKVVG